MKYYIDFDNTLFDTESFYNDLLQVVNEYGINHKKINDYYNQKLSHSLFNPINIINKLIEKHKLKYEIKQELDLFFQDLSKYLYNDTIDFLEYLIKNNYEINLLTYGDFDYQQEKINKSKIKDYFNKIIITNKHKALLDLDYENSIFIDDNKIQLEGLIKKKCKVIRIRRKGNKHYDDEVNDVLEYRNFSEYMKSLESN